jgi:hypothetical protein
MVRHERKWLKILYTGRFWIILTVICSLFMCRAWWFLSKTNVKNAYQFTVNTSAAHGLIENDTQATSGLVEDDTQATFAPIKTEMVLYTMATGAQYDIDSIRTNRLNYAKVFDGGRVDVIVKREVSKSTNDHPSWSKIHDYFDLEEKYEYIWYLDADAFIMSTKSIFDLIDENRRRKDCDIVIAADSNGVNGGSFVVKTTDWSRDFMTNVLQARLNKSIHMIDTWWEQAAMIWLIDNQMLHDHVCIVPQSELNAYPENLLYTQHLKTYTIWQKGMLVIHAPAFGYHHLVNYLKQRGFRPL